MPTSLKYWSDFPLTPEDVEMLWQKTIRLRHAHDDQVNIACVDEQEMKRLNEHYRGAKGPTNVLTFSYTGDSLEHDIALCVPVGQQEAKERNVPERDYMALLLVHAFLHATGLDHEEHEDIARQMRKAEIAVLRDAGLKSVSLDADL